MFVEHALRRTQKRNEIFLYSPFFFFLFSIRKILENIAFFFFKLNFEIRSEKIGKDE